MSTPYAASIIVSAAGNGQAGVTISPGGLPGPQGPALGPSDWLNVVTKYGADPTGSTDSTTAFQDAISAAQAVPGSVVWFPPGSYVCDAPLDADSTRGLAMLGPGGLSGGGYAAARITFTYAGSASALSARSSAGFILQGIQVLYNNAGFTGYVVDLSHATASDSALFRIRDCVLGGNIVKTAAAVIFTNQADTGTVEGCNIVNAVDGIYGITSDASYSNQVTVRGSNQFSGLSGASIRNPGNAWDISGNTFEALSSGEAGAVLCDSGVHAYGMKITGNWLGDITAPGGTQIAINGAGFDISGNYVGYGTGNTGIAVGANASGFTIKGNYFDAASGATAISLGSGCTGYDCGQNATLNAAVFPSPLTG